MFTLIPLVKMEDDVSYSTLVFSTSYPNGVAENENAVYATIKTTGEETSPSTAATAEEVAVPRYISYRKATVTLGLLCILLLAGLTTMCVLEIKQVSKYSSILAHYTNESMKYRKLLIDKATLETEKEELTAERDQFKNTLRLITQFSDFPVNKYCTLTNEEVRCEPCMKSWIQNGSSCYLFGTNTNTWLSWTASQSYCAENGGHLVVIDTLEEQHFISRIAHSYSKYNGNWIGLSKQHGKWIWTTGAELQSNGFWIALPENSQASCVLLKPNSADLNNWEVNKCNTYNKFICEMKVMAWPSPLQTTAPPQNTPVY